MLGLEVVLADGRVLRTGGRTHKNKTGFDVSPLGTPGTLIGPYGIRAYGTGINVPELTLAASHPDNPFGRAARFLVRRQNRDGGFELTEGRGSDAQSTAWAIQGLVAAGRTPPRNAFAYGAIVNALSLA